MYFAAIVCPPELDKKILDFKTWMKEQFGCVVALRSPAHITLVPPFWLAETREPELLQSIGSFINNMSMLEIQLDNFSHFNKKVLFIRVAGDPVLEEFKSQVTGHLMQSFPNIIKEEARPFQPHITIANRDMLPGHFRKAWEYFSKKEFREIFHSSKISLLKLGPTKWEVMEVEDRG